MMRILGRKASAGWSTVAIAFALGVQACAQQTANAQATDVFSSSGGEVYTDAFSANCEKSNVSPYVGMNPLVCHGVMAPADSSGKCSLTSGTVLKQVGAACYYCAPISPPIVGIVVPVDVINSARDQGYECGVDQADVNCLAVCTRIAGGGNYVPPQGTTLVAPQPPAKGLLYAPGPPNTPSGPPNTPDPTAMDTAMSDCLKADQPGFPAQTLQPSSRQTAMQHDIPAKASTTPPALLPPGWQAFIEATAMAVQTQGAYNNKYYPGLQGLALAKANPQNPTNATDYMVGWLYHCLYNAGLAPKTSNFSPNYPTLLYSRFLNVTTQDPRVNCFNRGWSDFGGLPPLPLTPPGAGNASPCVDDE